MKEEITTNCDTKNIKPLEILNCKYPKCKKEGVYSQAFQVINKKDSLVSLPFCVYHHVIVIGGHFQARFLGGDDFELIGPLKEVEIVEQVMGAIEFTKKLKNDNKGLSKK